jgi:hypothetical protein
MSRQVVTLLAVVAVACGDPDEGPGDSDLTVHLAEDAYYIAVFVPHTSPADCLAESDPRSCAISITLCADGRAARRIGDVIQSGTYELDGPLANAMVDGTDFTFDVASRASPDDGANTTWILDDADYHVDPVFDTIDCQGP